MIKAITNFLMKWAEKRGRVFKITGSAGPDDVYLIRYYIIRSQYFNFFIHQFLRSDRDDLHDHPWDFVTYLVSGAYTENRWNEKKQKVDSVRRCNKFYDDYMQKVHLKQNTFVFRRATDQHQVVVDYDLKENEKHLSATTLFFSGPTKREWGFVRAEQADVKIKETISEQVIYSSKGSIMIRTWVPWRQYLGLPPETPGRG